MADAVDDDTLQAVLALWAQDTETLPALFARPPQAGPLKSTADAPQTLPYASVTSEAVPGKTVRYINGTRKEARKVTIAAWGTREQAVAALAAILSVFHSRLGAPGQRTLEFPGGAYFIKWWPTNDGTLTREETQREGQDVWKAAVEAEVYTTRAEV